jgi:DNA-binding Lrp family transcriptional regulator
MHEAHKALDLSPNTTHNRVKGARKEGERENKGGAKEGGR